MTVPFHYLSEIPQPIRVVIIEDNMAVNQWMSKKIKELENVELVGNLSTYKGAIELIKKEMPDVLILDLKLPDGNGLDILKEIRKSKLNITVMILTLNIQARNVCLKMGADHFFDKSTDMEILLKELRKLSWFLPSVEKKG